MEVGKISEGIAATIELLESIPVRGRDIEAVGFGLYTAIKNLKIINEAVIKAESGELFDESGSVKKEPDDIQLELVPMDEGGDRA